MCVWRGGGGVVEPLLRGTLCTRFTVIIDTGLRRINAVNLSCTTDDNLLHFGRSLTIPGPFCKCPSHYRARTHRNTLDCVTYVEL